MKTEQQLIDGLRRRKLRIAAYSVALLASLLPLVMAVKTYESGMAMIAESGKTHVDAATTPEAFMQQVLNSLSKNAEMSAALSRTYSLGILYAALVGVFLGMLVIEATGQSKDRALIRMWDEIQELKKKIGT